MNVMASTFDSSLSTPKDLLRLKFGDIEDPFILEDATYESLLDGGTQLTDDGEIDLAKALAAVCANKANEVQEEGVKKTWGDRAKFYRQMAQDLIVTDDDSGTTQGLPIGGVIPVPQPCVIANMNRRNGLR